MECIVGKHRVSHSTLRNTKSATCPYTRLMGPSHAGQSTSSCHHPAPSPFARDPGGAHLHLSISGLSCLISIGASPVFSAFFSRRAHRFHSFYKHTAPP